MWNLMLFLNNWYQRVEEAVFEKTPHIWCQEEKTSLTCSQIVKSKHSTGDTKVTLGDYCE